MRFGPSTLLSIAEHSHARAQKVAKAAWDASGQGVHLSWRGSSGKRIELSGFQEFGAFGQSLDLIDQPWAIAFAEP
jgi:hypothetical protein